MEYKDSKVTPVFHWGTQFAQKFDLTPYKSVLDIGCRKGHIAAYLGNQYPKQQFTAIDNFDDEIEHAKNHSLSNVIFTTQDALHLDSTDQFDAVTSFSCLHWIQHKAKALQSIYEALKPGGKAFLQFFAAHGRPKNDRFLYQTAKNSKWNAYFKQFSPDYCEVSISEISTLLQQVGFMTHRIEVACYETLFEHSDELQTFLSTWASHRHCVPKAKQDHFLADTVSAYLAAHHYSNKAAFPYYEYLLEIICEKPLVTDNCAFYRHSDIYLTPCEVKVLKQFLQGKTAKEIGQALCISAKTSEFHLANIKAKLNCHRRSEIYRAARKYGFIDEWFDKVL